ncbi:T9SS type A sorting domain-containing protein, partial [bacterium]|nr:T9SS type A sorting domain-containing protein [bacterium]
DPDSSAIVDVAALSPLTAWFAGGSSGLMLTTDGGQSFIPQFLPENRRAGQLQFFNADSGWIRSGRYLTYTTNGGQNWQAIPTMTMSGTYGMFFLDMQNGWVFGGKPATIEHTTDGGLTWTRQYQDSLYGETAVVGLSFTDPNVGWAAVWGLSLLHTTNGGATWNSVNIGGCGDWTTMQWTDPDHGYVLSDYEPMWYTTDAGTTWREAPNHIGSRMIDVDFPNASHGWVVGWNGTIVKWNGSALAAEPVARAAIPIQCMLSAFPNPFNPITTLEFTIPVTTRASLQVYDITGRLVQTLTDRVLPAGIYTQRLDASRLPSGVYFARLSAAGTDVTRKIVLIK